MNTLIIHTLVIALLITMLTVYLAQNKQVRSFKITKNGIEVHKNDITTTIPPNLDRH